MSLLVSQKYDLRFLGVERDPAMDHTEYKFLLQGYELSLHRMGDEFMLSKENGATFSGVSMTSEQDIIDYLKRQLPRFGFHKANGYV